MAVLVEFLVAAAVIAALTAALLWRWRLNLPPGPSGLPLFGNIFQMRSVLGDPMNLQRLARRHGPIMTIRVGALPLVVISSSALAHEALIDRGAIFASRPSFFFFDRQRRLSNNRRSVNAAPYGSHWRTMRRNMVSHVLSPLRVDAFELARHRVVSSCLAARYTTRQRGSAARMTRYAVRYTTRGRVKTARTPRHAARYQCRFSQ